MGPRVVYIDYLNVDVDVVTVHVVRLLCCRNGEYNSEWSGSLVPRLSNSPVFGCVNGKGERSEILHSLLRSNTASCLKTAQIGTITELLLLATIFNCEILNRYGLKMFSYRLQPSSLSLFLFCLPTSSER